MNGDAFTAEYPPRDNRPKRRPEMDTNGFYGDTFSSGFGDFYTAKKRRLDMDKFKRRPEMDTNGFYGDTFSSGFGDFYTAKRAPWEKSVDDKSQVRDLGGRLEA